MFFNTPKIMYENVVVVVGEFDSHFNRIYTDSPTERNSFVFLNGILLHPDLDYYIKKDCIVFSIDIKTSDLVVIVTQITVVERIEMKTQKRN